MNDAIKQKPTSLVVRYIFRDDVDAEHIELFKKAIDNLAKIKASVNSPLVSDVIVDYLYIPQPLIDELANDLEELANDLNKQKSMCMQ